MSGEATVVGGAAASFGFYHDAFWGLVYELGSAYRWAEAHDTDPHELLSAIRHRYPAEVLQAYEHFATRHPAVVPVPRTPKEHSREDHR